jgi:hypothetical protein
LKLQVQLLQLIKLLWQTHIEAYCKSGVGILSKNMGSFLGKPGS